MSTIHRIPTREKMAEMVVRLDQAGAGWHAPLFRACMAGNLRLVIISPGQRMPLSIIDPTKDRRPLVVILAGDLGGAEAAGPGDFPQAARLFRWAHFILLHGAGGEPWHYAMATEMARTLGRVVIVETGDAHLKDWAAFKAVKAPDTPGLTIAVRPGAGPHPIMGAPAGVPIQ